MSENAGGTLKENKEQALESKFVNVVDGGVSRQIFLLSSYFSASRQMTNFVPPPKQNENGQFDLGAKDYWLNKMTVFRNNMQWMLDLPHNRFWSQIVFGKDSWDSVITFLQEAYPFYLMDSLPQDEDITQMYFQIYNLVFNLLKRATTRKETENDWMTVKKFRALLYNYSIISFPILLDICAIYGENYKEEVQSIISRVFKLQPLYKEDLGNSIQSIKSIFQSLEALCSDRNTFPGELTKLSERKSLPSNLPLTKIHDFIYYLLDVSANLSTFLNLYPEAAQTFHLHQCEQNISSLYETVIPTISNSVKLQCFKDDTMIIYFNLMLKINHARYFLITLFHQCLEPIINSILTKSGSGDPELMNLCNDYLDSLSNSFVHKIFITDYNNKYSVENELDMMPEVCPELDNEKLNFLKQSFLQSCEVRKPEVQPSYPVNEIFEHIPQVPEPRPDPRPDPSEELFNLIREVKDILPQLGDGFIQKCLEHYNNSTSDVINAIFEESLPPALQPLDRELPFIPPECEPKKMIFNEMNGKTDEGMTGYRKKKEEVSFNEFVNDKTFTNEFRNKYAELGIIESLVDIYDDEYDDTYDGEVDVQEVGELERKFVVPRVLQPKIEKEEESEEEDDEVPQAGPSFERFCENPEDVRARYEQRRLSKTLKHPPRPKNVAGDPKDTEVMKSRNNKTVNKAAYANHNRKKAAKNKRGSFFP